MIQHKILVIDDEPHNIEIIIRCLNDNNYKTYVANNGKNGYKIALKTKPNLIITDWEMSGLSGIETIKLIKSNNDLLHIPIIMATGKNLKSIDLKVALEAGANDYIRKPIDKIELIARVNSMILLFETNKQYLKLKEENENKLIQKINIQEKELTYFTLKLVEHSNFKKSLSNNLNKAMNYANDDGKIIIKSITNSIEVNKNYSFWNEFEYTFKQVHQSFYEKLCKKCDYLTENERKLAIFYKLNMNTNDIASVTHQSIEALKKAKYRLRRKLEIESDTDLYSFFQKL